MWVHHKKEQAKQKNIGSSNTRISVHPNILEAKCNTDNTSSHSPIVLQFPGLQGESPYDGVPTEKEVSVDLSLTVIFSILATAGIVFAVTCLAFNFIFRNKKWVINLLLQTPLHDGIAC